MVCRGLDLDLSRKVAKNDSDTDWLARVTPDRRFRVASP